MSDKPIAKPLKSIWDGTGFNFAESLSYYQERYGAIGNMMLSVVLFKNFLFNLIIILSNWYQICFYEQNDLRIKGIPDLNAIDAEDWVYLDAALDKIKELQVQGIYTYEEINDALKVLFDEFAEKDQLRTEIVNARAMIAEAVMARPVRWEINDFSYSSARWQEAENQLKTSQSKFESASSIYLEKYPDSFRLDFPEISAIIKVDETVATR